MAQWQRIFLTMKETQETQVRFLTGEDSLEEERETHSDVLAWKVPRTEEPGGLQSKQVQSQTQLSVHAR